MGIIFKAKSFFECTDCQYIKGYVSGEERDAITLYFCTYGGEEKFIKKYGQPVIDEAKTDEAKRVASKVYIPEWCKGCPDMPEWPAIT
jgi:hypothetical protein